jgi:hypothetical protein
MADYPTVVLNDRPYALLVSHEVDRPAVYYGPSVPGATAVTFFMRAITLSLLPTCTGKSQTCPTLSVTNQGIYPSTCLMQLC